MPDFGWNYPPGVTGNEYEITWADYAKEVKGACPNCGAPDTLIEEGYKDVCWQTCRACGFEQDVLFEEQRG